GLAGEADRVHVALVGEVLADGGDEVLVVVALRGVDVGLEVLQPAVLGPLPGLVVADHDGVELAAAGRHRGGDLGAGLVLRQRDEVDLDAGVLLAEPGLQGDRVLHLRVGHDRDDEPDVAAVRGDGSRPGASGEQRPRGGHHGGRPGGAKGRSHGGAFLLVGGCPGRGQRAAPSGTTWTLTPVPERISFSASGNSSSDGAWVSSGAVSTAPAAIRSRAVPKLSSTAIDPTTVISSL